MHKLDFAGQVAVVTGGAQGIGGAVAKRLADSGACIVIWDTDHARAETTAATLGNGSFAILTDVSDWDSVTSACQETFAKCPKVDALINSAGVAGSNAPLAEYPVAEFRRIIEINLMGTFHTNRAFAGAMRTQNYGRIVNIASVAGKEGNPNASAYSASKAGVIGLTKSLGKELADVNVSVNCVTPAAARTRIFDQMSQDHIDYMLAKIPRGRFLELDEASAMIAWLASSENSFTTGSVFDLSGGRATY